MAAIIRRFPTSENFEFANNSKTKGLASNDSIFCPQLKCWDCICLLCYNCEIGFNGACGKLNEKIKGNPNILKELYRPVPELIKEHLSSTFLACEGKLLSIGSKRDRRKKLYIIKTKYTLKIRFIPKYEKPELPYKDETFFKEGVLNAFVHDEIVQECKSGDVIYSVNQNKYDIKVAKLMERLENGRNI